MIKNTITPLISVIVPTYNVKSYLVEALDSVVHQTYRNLEILVIDDGSTDGSSLICDEYAVKDGRIKVIHQKNKGLSEARNIGLDHMTGEIVAFLDPDDAFLPEMLQRMTDVMMAEDADVVTCNRKTYRTDGHLPKQTFPRCQPIVRDRNDALRALINGEISWVAWGKIYRRKCFDTIRYPRGHVYEDIDTTYKVFDVSDRIVTIEEPLIVHRKRSQSITEEYSLNSAKDRDRAYGHVVEYVKQHTPEIFSEHQKQKICRVRLAGMLGTFARSGKNAYSYREEVLRAAKDVDLRSCNIQLRGEYFMFCHCPKLYIAIHKPVRTIKKQIVVVKEKRQIKK